MARESRYDARCQLTPREREVRELLRLGLTDAEIGDRLGVSKSAVSHHVSAIISKLGVHNRYEAAYWPEPPPWWMGALAPVAVLWRKSSAALSVQASSLALGASGAALLTTLGGLALIGVLLARSSGDAPLDTSAPPAHVSGPGSAIDDAPAAEATARPLIRGDETTPTPAANRSQNAGPRATPTEPPAEAATLPTPAIDLPPTAAATLLASKRGLMAVDCDANKAGVQATCRYAVGETFFVQVRIARAPAGGYHAFKTKLSWVEGLDYEAAANQLDEILWRDCSFYSYHSFAPAPSFFLGCFLYPWGVEGRTDTGAILQFEFRCSAEGQSPIDLIQDTYNPHEGTHFMDGALNVINTETAGAQVACVNG